MISRSQNYTSPHPPIITEPSMAALLVLLVCSLQLSSNGVEGRSRKLTAFETPVAQVYIAAVRTQPYSNVKYRGGSGEISTHNPSVTGSQSYSSAYIKIGNGPDYIQAGWTVNPQLYGDHQTRLFIYYKGLDKQCFNLACPGFEVTNPAIPLDIVITPISSVGGPTYAMDVFISRDDSGRWRLSITQNKTEIGYWPPNIFTSGGLKDPVDLATYVQWGGEVSSPENEPRPQMGNGVDPTNKESQSTTKVAFVSNIAVINESGDTVMPLLTESYVNKGYYNSIDEGDTKSAFGHLVLYGGNGGE